LAPIGYLFFHAWEGFGSIDYGDLDMGARFHGSEYERFGWQKRLN